MESTFKMNTYIVEQAAEWMGITIAELFNCEDWDAKPYRTFAMICGAMNRKHEHQMSAEQIAAYFNLSVEDIKKSIAKHDVCLYSSTSYKLVFAKVMQTVLDKIKALEKYDVKVQN